MKYDPTQINEATKLVQAVTVLIAVAATSPHVTGGLVACLLGLIYVNSLRGRNG